MWGGGQLGSLGFYCLLGVYKVSCSALTLVLPKLLAQGHPSALNWIYDFQHSRPAQCSPTVLWIAAISSHKLAQGYLWCYSVFYLNGSDVHCTVYKAFWMPYSKLYDCLPCYRWGIAKAIARNWHNSVQKCTADIYRNQEWPWLWWFSRYGEITS